MNVSSALDHAWVRILGGLPHYTVETVNQLRLLFQKEAGPEQLDFPRLHSIILGLEEGDLEEELQKPDTDINVQDRLGLTAIAWAAQRNDNDALRLLLQYRADPEIKDTLNYKPIDHSILTKDPSTVQILVNSRVDVSQDEHGFNALLHAAYHHNDLRFIKPLLAAGCPLESRSRESRNGGHTTLARTALNDCDIVAEYLIGLGADINSRDSGGNTVFMNAVQCGSSNVIRVLLDHGADYAIPNASGYTVLHTAAEYGSVNVKTLRVLRDARLRGVDIFARTETGSTAADLLRDRGEISDEFLVAFAEFVESVQGVDPVVYGPLPSYRMPCSYPSG